MANLNTTCHKSTKRPTRTRPAPTTGLSITDLALAMAETEKVIGTLDAAGTVGKNGSGHQADESAASLEYDLLMRRRVEALMDRRLEALSGALYHLDPTTPSEVLSLALVLGAELNTLVANFTDHQNCAEARRAGDDVERAYHAVLLGLVRHVGLSSPILDRYLSPRMRVSTMERAKETADRADRLMKRKPKEVESQA